MLATRKAAKGCRLHTMFIFVLAICYSYTVYFQIVCMSFGRGGGGGEELHSPSICIYEIG